MNCKPGDLAIIIGASWPETLPNIGRICTVVSASGDSEWSWLCKGDRPFMDGTGAITEVLMVRDADLRPISGLPITDDIKDEVSV